MTEQRMTLNEFSNLFPMEFVLSNYFQEFEHTCPEGAYMTRAEWFVVFYQHLEN